MKDFKVRCVSNDGNANFYTVGKVYKVSTDGTLVTDTGFKINQGFKTVKDINKFSSSTFELVEDKPSFKVRCTKTRDSRFILNKIYEVDEHGRIADEKGYVGAYNTTESFEEWFKDGNWIDYKFELVEEPTFTKADLRTGMRVEVQNGKRYIVLKGFDTDKIVFMGNNGWHFIGVDMQNDMTFSDGSSFSINKVYNCPPFEKDLLDLTYNCSLLWCRPEPPKMTHKEIETELGHEFEYVKE